MRHQSPLGAHTDARDAVGDENAELAAPFIPSGGLADSQNERRRQRGHVARGRLPLRHHYRSLRFFEKSDSDFAGGGLSADPAVTPSPGLYLRRRHSERS